MTEAGGLARSAIAWARRHRVVVGVLVVVIAVWLGNRSGEDGAVPADGVAEQHASDAASTSPATSAGPRGDRAPVIVQGRVVDIVDGDTIDLSDGTRVRLAIVDTPEVHDGVEPCGPEAADFTGSFLAGQTVAVYRPQAAAQTDGYGRTLGEVVRVSDGASLNVALVRAGLGTIDDRFTHEDPDLADRLAAAASGAASPSCAPQAQAQPVPFVADPA